MKTLGPQAITSTIVLTNTRGQLSLSHYGNIRNPVITTVCGNTATRCSAAFCGSVAVCPAVRAAVRDSAAVMCDSAAVRQCATVCDSVRQCAAVCGSVRQCVAMRAAVYGNVHV